MVVSFSVFVVLSSFSPRVFVVSKGESEARPAGEGEDGERAPAAATASKSKTVADGRRSQVLRRPNCDQTEPGIAGIGSRVSGERGSWCSRAVERPLAVPSRTSETPKSNARIGVRDAASGNRLESRRNAPESNQTPPASRNAFVAVPASLRVSSAGVRNAPQEGVTAATGAASARGAGDAAAERGGGSNRLSSPFAGPGKKTPRTSQDSTSRSRRARVARCLALSSPSSLPCFARSAVISLMDRGSSKTARSALSRWSSRSLSAASRASIASANSFCCALTTARWRSACTLADTCGGKEGARWCLAFARVRDCAWGAETRRSDRGHATGSARVGSRAEIPEAFGWGYVVL